MRRLLALLLAVLTSTVPVQAQWVAGSRVLIPANVAPTVFYVWHEGESAAQNVPRRPLAADQWHIIDLSSLVPRTAVAVELQGILVSTGRTGVYCGMTITFRRHGSDYPSGAYQWQAVASLPGGAFRTPVYKTVALTNRKFEVYWHYAEGGDQCPMAISVALDKVIMP
jgi:hypothetical protein